MMQFSQAFAKNQERIGPVGAGHATKAINNILNVANLLDALQ